MKKAILVTALLIFLLCLCAAAESLANISDCPGTVTASGVALRPQPTKAVPALAKLKINDPVTVHEALSAGGEDWYRVSFESGGKSFEGYVLAEYVSVTLLDEDGQPVHLPVKLRVYAEAVCEGYNHVGYAWTREFWING